MVRHYSLGADDLALVRTKRRSVNRVGFAVQLCLLRYPGFGMGPAEQPSEAMIAFVSHQLGVPPADFADYAQRDQTRREHVVELQRYLCLRSFGLGDWRACLRLGSEAAWATDHGEPIVRAILAHLRANRRRVHRREARREACAGRRTGRAPADAMMTGKLSKSREELAAIVMDRLKSLPECHAVTGVVIAPVLRPKPGYANWHAAFTVKAKQAVPSAAWRIGSEVADEFDMT
jgi:uncharacterized protein DUF4158